MSLRVFVVDDDRDVVRVYEDLSELAGFEVIDHAYDGTSALEKYQEMNTKPDIVIMDERMPGMTGIETMKRLKELDASVKILFVSADPGARRPALDNGAHGFMLKPFSIKNLIYALENARSGE